MIEDFWNKIESYQKISVLSPNEIEVQFQKD